MFDLLIESMREDVPPIGFVVMSGSNVTLYTVCGTDITEHLDLTVDLPNKHRKGGQSSVRFERLGEEARHNYISKVIESIIRIYPSDVPIVIGGPASLKDKMAERLSFITTAPKVLRIVDIQYDKKQGLYELLRNCEDLVSSLQVAKERKWIAAFLNSLAMSDNLAVYGESNIAYCLEGGLIATLIVHEDMINEELPIMCERVGTELIIITDFLPESNQIKLGFGGKVGLLRYPVEMPDIQEEEKEEFEEFA